MSDQEVRAAVQAELAGLGAAEIVVRAAELIELVTRQISSDLADERAMAVVALREGGLEVWQIAQMIEGLTPQKVAKLLERGNAAKRHRAQGALAEAALAA